MRQMHCSPDVDEDIYFWHLAIFVSKIDTINGIEYDCAILNTEEVCKTSLMIKKIHIQHSEHG